MDLLVKPLDLELAHNVLLSELLKGRTIARLLLLLVTQATSRSRHDVDCSNLFLRVAEALRVRTEYLNRALSEVADLTLERVQLQWTQVLDIIWHERLVGIGLEQVLRHLGFLTLLEAPEDHIDPLWQGHAH